MLTRRNFITKGIQCIGLAATPVGLAKFVRGSDNGQPVAVRISFPNELEENDFIKMRRSFIDFGGYKQLKEEFLSKNLMWSEPAIDFKHDHLIIRYNFASQESYLLWQSELISKSIFNLNRMHAAGFSFDSKLIA